MVVLIYTKQAVIQCKDLSQASRVRKSELRALQVGGGGGGEGRV